MTDKLKVPEFEDEDNNPFHAGLEDANGKDDESLLLYNNSVSGKDAFNSVSYETRVSKVLRPNSNLKIQITEANNSSEGNANASKKYIVYTIKLVNVDNAKEELQIRRRYSDFESLREALTRNFPLLIIPPIPPKNYLNFSVLNGIVASRAGPNAAKKESAAYSYINSTHLNSSRLIEHRKRLLTNFLNNCLKIPQIRNLEFFAKFLDPNANWSDEISLFNSQLPKDIYHSNPENGLKTGPAYAHLPNPVGPTMSFLKPILNNSKKLGKKTNKLLNGAEHTEPADVPEENGKVYIINTSPLDDINKKIMDNFIGLAHDYTELGTVFNSSSLLLADAPIIRAKSKEVQDDQTAKLNIILDKMGQVFERSYITINLLINDLETKFSEPLGEAVQYSSILQFIQKFQSRKLRQQSLLDAEVKDKKKTLQELLNAEEEATRIENSIKTDPISKNNNYKLNEPASDKAAASSKFNLFSIKKISLYVSGIIDQNPEETRKQKIAALQAKIITLEKCQGIMLEDVAYIANEVDKNFKQFHNRQLKIIYDILLCYNGFLIGWAKKNIDIWEDIREEIVKL